ncbi:hypothetical protein BDK51DRAFT_39961 [Blyttiomyces helicus]|uniref:Uncharacterized protein n=1 Tax=Blyttiomyces helicus TaxID=388810 RepID=A0A4P9WT66_9FUNG|nr:hypothetical protein BDK51DRAFT_39961 [Blyttiomyces helicus]|eukprot:RKO94530.1 hypothetical protein BDK51DRAFT_39961 [Blyttiomyces helicus]
MGQMRNRGGDRAHGTTQAPGGYRPALARGTWQKNIYEVMLGTNRNHPKSAICNTNPTESSPKQQETTSNVSATLEIDMLLLAPEGEKKLNFIRILLVLSTTANHRGGVKDLQKLYENLTFNTKLLFPPCFRHGTRFSKAARAASCMTDPIPCACSRAIIASAKERTLWTGGSSTLGSKQLCFRSTRGATKVKTSASSVVSSRSRRSLLSSSSGSNAEVVGAIEGEADGIINRAMETEEAGTDSERNGETDSEGHVSPRGKVLLDGSTQDGYPVEAATPADSSKTAVLCAKLKLGGTSILGSTASTAASPSTTPKNSDSVTSTSPKNYNADASPSQDLRRGNLELADEPRHGRLDLTEERPSECPNNTEELQRGRLNSSEGTKGVRKRIDISNDAAPHPFAGHALGIGGLLYFWTNGYTITNNKFGTTRTTWTQGQIPQRLDLNTLPMDFNMLPVLLYQPATPLAMMLASPYGFGGSGFGGFGGYNFGKMGMGIGGGWMQGNGFHGQLVQPPMMIPNASFMGDGIFTNDILNVQPLPPLHFEV